MKVKAALHEDALKEDKDAQRALGLMVERTKKVSSDEPSQFESVPLKPALFSIISGQRSRGSAKQRIRKLAIDKD